MRKKDDGTSKCPYCGKGPVGTIDSRHEGAWRIRRKRCTSCGKRWNTQEVPSELVGTIIRYRVLLDTMKYTIDQLINIMDENPLLNDKAEPNE